MVEVTVEKSDRILGEQEKQSREEGVRLFLEDVISKLESRLGRKKSLKLITKPVMEEICGGWDGYSAPITHHYIKQGGRVLCDLSEYDLSMEILTITSGSPELTQAIREVLDKGNYGRYKRVVINENF